MLLNTHSLSLFISEEIGAHFLFHGTVCRSVPLEGKVEHRFIMLHQKASQLKYVRSQHKGVLLIIFSRSQWMNQTLFHKR